MNKKRKYQYKPHDEFGQHLVPHIAQAGFVKRTGRINQAALAEACSLDEAIINKMLIRGMYRSLLFKVIAVLIRRDGFTSREEVTRLLALFAGELNDAKRTELFAKVNEACNAVNLPDRVFSELGVVSASVVAQADIVAEYAILKQSVIEFGERLREMGLLL